MTNDITYLFHVCKNLEDRIVKLERGNIMTDKNQLCMEAAEECVEAIIEELENIPSFDAWWFDKSGSTQDEIKKNLQNIVSDYIRSGP